MSQSTDSNIKKYYKWVYNNNPYCPSVGYSDVTDIVVFLFGLSKTLDESVHSIPFYLDFFKEFPEVKNEVKNILIKNSSWWSKFFKLEIELKKLRSLENRTLMYARMSILLEE
jgi:hypothetical protein